MRRIVHIAADDPEVRAALAAIVERYDVADVVYTSREGMRGVNAVTATDPDVILLACAPTDDVPGHASWYRTTVPHAYVIGFAFTDHQARDFETSCVDAVAKSGMGRSAFADLLARAIRPAGPYIVQDVRAAG